MRYFIFLSLVWWPALAAAQDNSGGLFNFNPSSTDISVKFLTAIFGVVPGVLGEGGSQIMPKLFGIFNSGVAILAILMLIYVLVVSTLNTAQDGQVMGRRWSSAWVPIRLVTGIGLLLPKANGYSIIQILVMWVVVQGIGLANNIWNTATSYVFKVEPIIKAPSISVLDQRETGLATSVYLSNMCMMALQKQYEIVIEEQIRRGVLPKGTSISDFLNPVNVTAAYEEAKKKGAYALHIYFPSNVKLISSRGEIPIPAVTGACGTISIALSPFHNDELLNNYYKLPFLQKLIHDAAVPARTIVSRYEEYKNSSPASVGPFNIGPVHVGTSLLDAMSAFSISSKKYQREWLEKKKRNTNYIEEIKRDGWIVAAGHYFKILNADRQGYTYTSVDNSISFVGPWDIFDKKRTNLPFLTEAQKEAVKVRFWNYPLRAHISAFTKFAGMSSSQYNNSIQDYLQGKGNLELKKHFMSLANKLGRESEDDSPIAKGLKTLQTALVTGGLVDALNALTELVSVPNSNPILGVTRLGIAFINIAQEIWVGLVITLPPVIGGAGLLSIFASPAVIAGLLAIVFALVPLMLLLSLILLVSGVSLAYYVPFIPFLIFLFGAIGWLVGVIQSMIAAPLVAIALASPDGNSEVAGRAGPGLMLLLNLFLRPSMMIFGLITAIALSTVALWLLNGTFNLFFLDFYANNIHGFEYGGFRRPFTHALTMLFFTIIFVHLVILSIKKTFELIHIIPDQVLKFVGGGMQESLGSQFASGVADSVQQSMQQSASKVGEVSQQVGKTVMDMGTQLQRGAGGIYNRKQKQEGEIKAQSQPDSA